MESMLMMMRRLIWRARWRRSSSPVRCVVAPVAVLVVVVEPWLILLLGSEPVLLLLVLVVRVGVSLRVLVLMGIAVIGLGGRPFSGPHWRRCSGSRRSPGSTQRSTGCRIRRWIVLISEALVGLVEHA